MLHIIQKLIKYLLIFFVIIIGLEFFIKQLEFKQYSQVLKDTLKENYNLNLFFKKNLKLKILPFPRFYLNEVLIYNSQQKLLLKAPLVEMDLSIKKLFYEKNIFPINSLLFENAAIYTSDLDSELLNYNQLKDIKQYYNHQLGIKTVKLINSRVVYTSNLERYKINNLNFYLNISDFFRKTLTTEADFTFNSFHYTLNGDIKNFGNFDKAQNINFKIKNEIFNLILKGKLTDLKSTPSYMGNLTLSFAGNKKQNFTAKHTNVNNFTAKLKFKDNILKIFQFRNKLKNSDNIKGNIFIDFTEAPKIHCDLNIKTLDLDLILNSAKQIKQTTIPKSSKICNYILKNRDFSIPKNVSSSINIEIENIKLFQDYIKNFKLDINIFTKKAFLNDLSFTMPGMSVAKVNGIVTTNRVRPKFDGELIFVSKVLPEFTNWLHIIPLQNDQYNSLMLKSDISILPHILELNNIKFASNNLRMLGKVIISEDSSHKLNTNAFVNINALNLKSIGLNELFYNILKTLYITDLDKTGYTFTKLTNDFHPLRKLNAVYNINVNINKLNLQNQLLNNFFTSITAKQNALKIHHFELENNSNKIAGDLEFLLLAFKPYLKTNLQLDTFNVETFKNIFPMKKLNEDLMYYIDNNDFYKKKIADKEIIPTNINLFGINNIDGELHTTINNLILYNNILQNFKLYTTLNDGVIKIDNLQSEVFGGEVALTGNITAMQPIIYIDLAASTYNINPNPLFYTIFKKEKIGGYTSMSGIFNTSGADWSTLKEKLTGKIRILGKNITWNGFNTAKIIQASDSTTNSYEDDLKILNYYSQYGTSFFDSISGDIQIKDQIATIPNLMIKTNRATGSFAANYYISNDKLDSIANFSFIPIGSQSPLLFSFVTTGNMQNPDTKFEGKNIISYLRQKNIQSIPPYNNSNNAKQEKTPYLRDMTTNMIQDVQQKK